MLDVWNLLSVVPKWAPFVGAKIPLVYAFSIVYVPSFVGVVEMI